MNKKTIMLLLTVFVAETAFAQKIKHDFCNTPLPDALIALSEDKSSYRIHFVFDDLEDFTVTTSLRENNMMRAIRKTVGFYPVKITQDGKNIFLECTQKADTKLTGKLVDAKGKPVMYANITVLNENDSTFITGGVSNEAGQFVIPCKEKRVLVKITCIGFAETIRKANVGDMGTIRMFDEVLTLKEVKVVESRSMIKQTPDRIIYLVKNDPYAKGMNILEALGRIPRVSVVNESVSVVGKSSVRYILDGRLMEMDDEAIKLKLQNLQTADIEKVEVITVPPARYAAESNAAYISITTRNESLGTRGNVWGRGAARENVSYFSGASIYHTARKVELSADAGWTDDKQLTDETRTYIFDDHVKTTTGTKRSDFRHLNADATLKYKITPLMSAGVIANYYNARDKYDKDNLTSVYDEELYSVNHAPSRPNNAITLTGFYDWMLDDKGRMLSFTYNYFNMIEDRFADVTTNVDRLTNSERNRYRINSAKIDAILPFTPLILETGVAYTEISNYNRVRINNLVNGQWVNDESQSNIYDYTERKAAIYASVTKNFSPTWFGRVSLRYEHTQTRGIQHVTNERHNADYNHVFPTVNISWNGDRAGRLSFAYSAGITRPHFSFFNPLRYYETTTDYVTGNPDLKPSVSHNAEINYSYKGLYAVLYNSYNHNTMGMIMRFLPDGVSQYTLPENCVNSDKAGLYVSYNGSPLDWWNFNIGAEVFGMFIKSNIEDIKYTDDRSVSGKVEANTSWMLNRQKTLVFNINYGTEFPTHYEDYRYKAMTWIGCSLRYSLLNSRLNIEASLFQPFTHLNVAKSSAYFSDFTLRSRFVNHTHSVALRVSYNFGRDKVKQVWRDTKESESQRAY